MRLIQHESLIPSLVVCLMGFLLLNKPVHIDEANFLMLTQGLFEAPHLVEVNWQGKTQAAFDVLSNPAGIAWWLWPVRESSEFWMRLWMLPWSILALWGASELGAHFWSYTRPKGAWLLVCTPIFWNAHLSLMPDMPLMALTFSGYALYFKGRRGFGALLVGLAFLFRYSASITILMFLLLPVFKRELWSRGMLWVLFGPIMLFVWDLYTYGMVHFIQMIGFQSVERTVLDRVHALASLFAMLSGGAISMMAFSGSWFIWALSFIVAIVLVVPLGFDIGTLWGLFWVALGVFCVFSQFRKEGWKSKWVFVGFVLALFFGQNL